jgi:hypothetical protein
LESGKTITGKAALLETASVTYAGFSLFTHKRLIVGSDDETYRPKDIFGTSNSYVYQRLVGEIDLNDFKVTHTKNGYLDFKVEEDEFISKLKLNLDSGDRPLLKQARQYRRNQDREPKVNLEESAQEIAENTASIISRELPTSDSTRIQPVQAITPPKSLPVALNQFSDSVNVEIEGEKWEVTIEFSNDLIHALDWIDIADNTNRTAAITARKLQLRLSLQHPFTQRYIGVEYENLELLMRVGSALVLAELFARQSGVEHASDVRRRVNDLLREVFSKG